MCENDAKNSIKKNRSSTEITKNYYTDKMEEPVTSLDLQLCNSQFPSNDP